MNEKDEKIILIEFEYDRYGTKFIQFGSIIGHKGNTFLEAGYVYAPYIPMFIMGIDPATNDSVIFKTQED